tara:strand:+ start:698 stop:958 length:261 start_codon:yes stop_codon:yes gene_type:complete
MFVKAILPSNVAYYDMTELPYSIRLSDNTPLDASGNVLPTNQLMIQLGDLMEGAHALISEITIDPFPVSEVSVDPLPTTESTNSDY